MSDPKDIPCHVALIVAILFLAIGGLIGFIVGDVNGNKQGQIDALTGKVQYELVTNADRTRTWEYVDSTD